MNVTTSWSSAALALVLLLAWPMHGQAQIHQANTPPWDGYWIWAPRSADAPALEVDLHAWLIRRPGGWSTALTHRIIGNATAAGLTKVYWHLEDEHGRRLYPSEVGDRVLRWPNWGCDFSAFDFPASAMAVAQRCKMPIVLVARSSEVYNEARRRYVEATIVMDEILHDEQVVAAETMHPANLARRHIARQTHRFRRTFETSGAVEQALITISGQRRYHLYLNGTLLGADADWWRGETYDVTSLLNEAGRHVLAIEVEPDDQFAGVLLNMRWLEAGEPRTLITDSGWRVAATEDAGWTEPGFDDSAWQTPGIVGFEGVGPRFRLKEPWRNPRPLRSDLDHLPMQFVRDAQLRSPDNDTPPQTLLADSAADETAWAIPALPATLEIHLSRPTRLREIRLHSGDLSLYEQSHPVGNFMAYQLQSYEAGRWVNLVPPVTSAANYQGEDRDAFVAYHAFSPRQVRRLRLIIHEAYTPGNAADARAYLRQIQLIKAFDESGQR